MAAIRMGRSAGYVSIVEPGRPIQEGDTLQCVHCGAHWFTKPGSGMQRGWCLNCSGPHCGRPKCWECIPFMKRIEAQEQKQRFLESLK